MALPKNRNGVQEILKIITPRIIGKELEGFSCSCGTIHCPSAIATSIEPSGNLYPGQETCWATWSVSMIPKEHDGDKWSCGIDMFITVSELKKLFTKYFPDPKDDANPYELQIRGRNRVDAKLPVAVRIMDNEHQTRFSISWGISQKIAEEIKKVFSSNPRFIARDDQNYTKIINLLRDLSFSVIIYKGGPEPELAYESKWLMNYDDILNGLNEIHYKKVFYQNSSESFRNGVESYDEIDIAFSKED